MSEGDYQRMYMITQGNPKMVRDCCLRDDTTFLLHYT